MNFIDLYHPLQLLYQLFYHSANATTKLDKPLNWTEVYKCILDWVALYHSLTDVVPTWCTKILLMPLLSWTRPTTKLSSNGAAYFNTRSSVNQYCHKGHSGIYILLNSLPSTVMTVSVLLKYFFFHKLSIWIGYLKILDLSYIKVWASNRKWIPPLWQKWQHLLWYFGDLLGAVKRLILKDGVNVVHKNFWWAM